MPTEVLYSVRGVHLGEEDSTRNPWRSGLVSEREVIQIADQFPRVERFFCPRTVSDTVLRKIVKLASLTSLDLLGCGKVTDLGLSESGENFCTDLSQLE
jgi:hypothetical protein